jgi:hypothetical protein
MEYMNEEDNKSRHCYISTIKLIRSFFDPDKSITYIDASNNNYLYYV